MRDLSLVKAIQKLRPTAEFTYTDNDYSTINWIKIEGNAPTQAEIDEAIKQVKAEEAQTEATKAQAKAAAEGKLAALGLTTYDLRALGL